MRRGLAAPEPGRTSARAATAQASSPPDAAGPVVGAVASWKGSAAHEPPSRERRIWSTHMNDSEERDLQRRVRQRAQKLWEEAGRPAAGSEAYLDQASELVAIEDNRGGAMRPLRPSERAAPED